MAKVPARMAAFNKRMSLSLTLKNRAAASRHSVNNPIIPIIIHWQLTGMMIYNNSVDVAWEAAARFL
ncbi:hypothetical protein ACC870_38400, partial [Rhizobium ruizarguesonis]